MTKTRSGAAAYSTRVLHALAVNRQAKLNFPGVFMGLSGHETGDGDVIVGFDHDAAFRDGAGELNWPTLCVLVDIALGSVTRIKAGPSRRPATVQLQMQMTGAPVRDEVVAHARFTAYSERTAVRQALSTASIMSGETLLGHASGAFVMLDLPGDETQATLPWVPESVRAEPLTRTQLDEDELAALRSCKRAERAATDAHPFIEHFWCGIPKKRDGKAQLAIRVAPHLGNRVGHIHGGVLVGAAAQVASAAAPATMRLSNITAWFVSPGLGPKLKVNSAIVQQGRNLAVVHTRIVGATGKLVLEVTSQHVATSA